MNSIIVTVVLKFLHSIQWHFFLSLCIQAINGFVCMRFEMKFTFNLSFILQYIVWTDLFTNKLNEIKFVRLYLKTIACFFYTSIYKVCQWLQ